MPTKRPTYREKLMDPRWQRKRLEIMERDKFTCRHCASADETLHVHHGYYARGKDPWDYANETLQTLCHECHGYAQDRLDRLHRAIAVVMFWGNGWCEEYWKDRLLDAMRNLCLEHEAQFTTPHPDADYVIGHA